jgi:hypothetical protein
MPIGFIRCRQNSGLGLTTEELEQPYQAASSMLAYGTCWEGRYARVCHCGGFISASGLWAGCSPSRWFVCHTIQQPS